jgi:formylglycine-generating enzyme required for sulfatase activity
MMMKRPDGCKPISLLPGAVLLILFCLPGLTMGQSPEAGKTFTNSVGMKFVYIPPGTFMMGSPPDEPSRDHDETPHRVTLTRGFYVQTTEVTQGQWKAVMGNNPSTFKDCGDNCPVESVSWQDVQKFIRELNHMEGTDRYRLPSEAEWEYACRAGTNTPYFFGQAISRDQVNYDGKIPLSSTAKGRYRKRMLPAVAFAPNAWGLYNMHTDVWEWCQDWFGRYPPGPVTDPARRSAGMVRVVRGGRWFFHDRLCRSADRGMLPMDYRSHNVGFRLARTP